MDTKLKKFSHSIFVKIIVFLLMIVGIVGSVYTVLHVSESSERNLDVIFEDSFIESHSFKMEYETVVNQLAVLIDFYKSEDNILAGHTIDSEEFEQLTDDIKQEMISDELRNFQLTLNNVNKREGLIYYATDGEHTFTNSNQTEKDWFKEHPVYYLSEDYDFEVYPSELEQTNYSYTFPSIHRLANPVNSKIFVGYPEAYLDSISSDWLEAKAELSDQISYVLIFMTLFFISLIYSTVTTGRHLFKDKKVHMHWLDKLYVDLNLIICFGVTMLWFLLAHEIFHYWETKDLPITAITIPTVAVVMILFLSLVRHLKNKTFFKHSLLYILIHSIYKFIKAIYDSGSLGVKVVVVVILYPMITAVSLLFFPITIGVAVWLVLKQVKSFKKIQEGTKLMNQGNLQHQIDIDGTGEFATLATNINGINQNFKQAVHNELKNERMKTELITNVSHDIRTPLTSLITYTDLLKTETNPEKIQEYVEILDQKSKRLKMLTDDLFSAAKASSGDIPVDLQQIDVVALVNQGIGEVSEQISEKNFTFKLNYAEEKMFVTADGKLLWRSIENILSNIFNYGLEGSRVYIDITHEDGQTLINFKNMSKYELNITEDELMERFKRGDDSRSSYGSGLGLSITKSLIENQKGNFEINIDGDLFKSMIYLPSADQDDSL